MGPTRANVYDLVISRGLCSYCGACVAVCPRGALRLGVDAPEFDREACADCSLCVRVCPALDDAPPVRELPARLYVGRAASEELRRRAQSGGVVTALITYALASGLVGAVLATAGDASEPQRAVPVVLRSPDEAPAASGSRFSYSPVLALVPEASRSSASLCVVGLPCHMRALRLAQERLRGPWLSVKLTIGLLCFGCLPYSSLRDKLLSEFGVSPAEVERVDVRRGVAIVSTRSGAAASAPLREVGGLAGPACLRCQHFLPPACDVAVGSSGAPDGHSVIIPYTEAGERLVSSASEEGLLEAREVGEEVRAELARLAALKRRRARHRYKSARHTN